MSKATPTNRIGSMFPSNMDSLINSFFTPMQGVRTGLAPMRVPAAIWEEEGKVFVELDAPGVEAGNVNVTFENGQLTLELERKAPETKETTPNFVYHERRYGKVSYSVGLPETVDPESIEASLTDGVLRVSIAKLPEAQPRRIEVRNN